MTPSPLQRRRRVGLLQSESTLGSWKSAIFEQYVRLALDVDRQDSLGERLYNKLFSDRVRCDLAKGRISIISIILFHSTPKFDAAARRCAPSVQSSHVSDAGCHVQQPKRGAM